MTLAKYLMKLYNVPAGNVIRHYDDTGKICPAHFVTNGMLWQDLLNKLTKMEGVVEMDMRYQTITEFPEWGKDVIQHLVDKGYIADGNHLDVSYDMVRMFAINYQAGLYQ